jgi:hypothetical protein
MEAQLSGFQIGAKTNGKINITVCILFGCCFVCGGRENFKTFDINFWLKNTLRTPIDYRTLC